MMYREEAANEIADVGWCGEQAIDHVDEDGFSGYRVTQTMYISDTDVDQYLAEQAACAAEEARDARRDDEAIESEGGGL